MPVIDEQNKPWYAGLNDVSAAIWRQWLVLYQDKFEAFWYNVRTGAGVRPPADFPPELKRDWYAITAMRIDVVAEREDQTWVIEVSERPGKKELGALQLYAHTLPLYQGQSPPQLELIKARNAVDFLLPTAIRPVIIPALVCRFLGSDMAAVFATAGIMSFVFPGMGGPKLPPQFLPSTVTPP
jgi:hypothetical protein